MVQQWFLDLDGVRSGPYQTPEVLGLIAEGEVLPHHRISSSLKDQPWTTILEWRLEQAKQPAPTEKKSYVPEGKATGTPPQNKPYDIRWNDPSAGAPKPPPSDLAREVGAVDLNPEAGEDEIEEVIQVLSQNPAEIETEKTVPSIGAVPPSAPPPAAPPVAAAPPAAEPVAPPPATKIVLEPVHKPESPAAAPPAHAPASPPAQAPHSPAHPPHGTPAAAPAEPGSTPVRAKRDPMAEMFDMLQNTRQKREAKEKAAHQEKAAHGHSHAHPTPHHEREHRDHRGHSPAPSQPGSSWVKTVVIGLLITLAGFMLGQLFQQSSETPPTAATSTEKNLTAPAQPGQPATEVIDRSTDKMTIRARVERQPEPPPPPIAIPRNKPAAQAVATPAMNDKEVQELRDLKKELQELKALKEELRNAPAAIDDGSNIPMDEDYLTAPGYEGTGGAEYSPNDAPMNPGAGGFHTPPPRDLNPPQAPVNY